MIRIPDFYFRRAVASGGATLEQAEDGGFQIFRNKGKVTLHCYKPWRPEFEAAYRRQAADSVEIFISKIPSWAGFSLNFLPSLPGLQHLALNLDLPMNLAPLAELDGLESLSIEWRSAEPPKELDFRRFGRLLRCSISWYPEFASALEVASLRILNVWTTRRLKVLELRRLPHLVELGLWDCPSLERVELSDQVRLLALELIRCSQFRPDMNRLSADLRYLSVMGRVGFSIEEIVAAQALEFVCAELPSKKFSWSFLKDLPNLKAIRLIDLKIPKEVAELVRSLNEASGHGPTLGAAPSGQFLEV